jgi:hypothetical protein
MSNALMQILANGAEELVDWTKITKKISTDEEIDAMADKLNWEILSRTYPFSPALFAKHLARINTQSASMNSALPTETISAFADKFDSELSQRYHKYSDEMIMDMVANGAAGCLVLLTYQKLSDKCLRDMHAHFVAKQQFTVVRQMATTAIQHQQVSKEFLQELMSAESNGSLFDREMVLRHQSALPIDWLESVIVTTPETRRLLLANYVLEDKKVLGYIVNYEGDINLQEILMKQRLQEPILHFCLEIQPANREQNLRLMVFHQQISIKFLQEACARFELDKETVSRLYNTAFMRTLKPSDPDFLAWNDADIEHLVLPVLDIGALIRYTIKHLPEFLNYIRSRKILVDWYVLLTHQQITPEIVVILKDYLPPLQMWYCMHRAGSKNVDEMRWWKTASPAQIIDLLERYNTEPELRCFLEAFVYATNWTSLMNNENLPEWFITIFAQYSKQIESRMNGISYWWKVIRYQKLTSNFIDLHFDKFDVRTLLVYQTLNASQMSRLEPFMDDEIRALANLHQPWATPSKQ